MNPHTFTYHPGNAWRNFDKARASRATRSGIARQRRYMREHAMLWNGTIMAERIGALR